MIKAELVHHVAATVQLPKQQTDAVITQCLQTIKEAVQAGESVELLKRCTNSSSNCRFV
jgi:nucleoid DNA-binding protein